MDGSSPVSDPAAELDALRRRAYGPHPDIQADPAALARLTELEAARTASRSGRDCTPAPASGATTDGAPVADPPPAAPEAEESDGAAGRSPGVEPAECPPRSRWQHRWHRATATRARRSWFVAGTLAVLFALAYTVGWFLGPRPDAVLHQSAGGGDEVVFSMLDFLGADVDRSSIRGYEPYRGVEPWFAVDRQGLQCFMIIDRSGPMVDGANCVPPGVGLFADIGTLHLSREDPGASLPDGSIIRFHHRGDSVDVFVYPASKAD